MFVWSCGPPDSKRPAGSLAPSARAREEERAEIHHFCEASLREAAWRDSETTLIHMYTYMYTYMYI